MRSLVGIASPSGGAEYRRKGMLRQSENIAHRLFTRQICRSNPNAHIQQARKLYENIVPSHTIYDVDCPDHTFRKFTNDGQYLICFSRNHQDLIVYRHKWLNFCVKGEVSDHLLNLPPKSKKFESYFTHLYTLPLALGSEVLCKDFFLSTENGLYGIFATSTVPDNSTAATDGGAVPGVPSTEKITICLVSLAEGQISDQRSFYDDFIQLGHNMGVFLYDDLLAVLSIRFQCIRIFQVRDTGRFVDVRTIGAHCREDDELVLNSQSQDEESYQKNQAALRKARGLPSKADTSVSGRGLDSQGSAWPPAWNMKRSHSSRQGHRRRNHATRTSIQAPNTVSMGQLARPENVSGGSVDPSVNGSSDQMHIGEIDMQYDDYFRGLFATLEDTAVSHVNGSEATDVGTLAGNLQGSVSSSSRERVASPPLHALLSNGHATAYDLTTASLRLDSAYGNMHTGQIPDGSTSGTGGQYSSAGTSQFERSYTSTSGDSLDRYTSGRGSPSVRYTSTTMTSSDSGSRSESSRLDASVSGGSISYGSGAGGNGSVLVQSANGNAVEYLVTSRTQAQQATLRQVTQEASLPNGSHQEIDERISFSRILMDNFASNAGTSISNGHAFESVSNGHAPDHRWTHGIIEEPIPANDRTLPVRFFGERSTLASGRIVQNGDAIRAPVSLRDSNNGNRGGGRANYAQRRPTRDGGAGPAGGLRRNRPAWDDAEGGASGRVLGGIKQRLLSFIFQGVWNEDVDPITKAQRLKRFYYHFQHYVDLVMWKVQFLDRYHLLIKFGSVDGVLQRNSDTSHQTAFLAVYNLETTEMLGFYQNSSEEFLLSFEQFCDHFRVAPRYPLYMNFISSYSNNSHVREQLHKQRVACSSSFKAVTHSQVVKRTLAWVPFNAQCQSPSAYFDQSLFHYDEKVVTHIHPLDHCFGRHCLGPGDLSEVSAQS